MGNTLKPRLEHAEKTGVCSLSKCQIKEFPAELQIAAGKLRSLDLSFNKLKLIPDTIGTLGNLKVLNLSHNKIIKLPNAICQLTKLETLNMAKNHLANLPADFGKLPALKTLNLSENKLKKFPLQIARLAVLDVADLTGNVISEMTNSEELDSLNCSELLLNSNQLAVLPSHLANCPRLKILRVQENCLTLDGVPSELLASSGINALSLEGNLFEERELHQIPGWEAYQERYTAAKKKMY
ncbi:leucine-rich repeat-containing protein 57-like [Tropilaelaps mercedesae]|uniref:Leucine-rich repeat-containing protein 57-like n=1 Tax=Tropilaelaps mercedesae TaxID=418985 RepID=A0A1V9XCC0_9ACAR|nr:leucine-rich repeat-containing protein 57-like [Tropilaelaps mercedesae]